jgi:CopG family nickel-responsive transcriptional regulator
MCAYGSITNIDFRNTRYGARSVTVQAISELARLSVSLPGELLERLDAMVAERDLPSRSQLISELIRQALARHGESRSSSVLAGTLTLIYRADSGRVRHALARIQSGYIKEVISSQHVLLEDDQSLEVLLVQGPARRLRSLCDDMRRIRGVHQIELVTTTALLPPLHSHGAAVAAGQGHATGRSGR